MASHRRLEIAGQAFTFPSRRKAILISPKPLAVSGKSGLNIIDAVEEEKLEYLGGKARL